MTTQVSLASPIDPQTDGGALLDAGLYGPHVDEFRATVRDRIDRLVLPHLDSAEAAGRFPAEVIRELGATGLFAERWHGGGDTGRSVVLANELGRAGAGGLAVGISLHLETVLSMLVRFGGNDYLRQLRDQAMRGELVGCIGASEATGGSDLERVGTIAQRTAAGWHIEGRKKFVSLGSVADFCLVLCRVHRDNGKQVARLGVAAVPRDGLHVEHSHAKVGTHSLDTVRVAVSADIPEEAMLGRPGLGLAVINYGLTMERLGAAAQLIGTCELALGLAVAHADRRSQFGARLRKHQVIEYRLADLAARIEILRAAALATAAGYGRPGGPGAHQVAGLKVTAAQTAEQVVSECMHIFGGAGYLPEETPMGRLWRDVRLGRIGAGTDEMMWSIRAVGLTPDNDSYDRLVHIST
ncbi:acyl-CoA dehydrogenase family protein [Nocardia sp. CS682]|uniref:acyl-CoA dehydrogenase family protein n=1 Tax=Nocardia sp. CS682 TaxID=1047172 RepID=UPI001074CED5|nr:acyl-CoA dehydrogenase family protein [Nocardia sp. CS682]